MKFFKKLFRTVDDDDLKLHGFGEIRWVKENPYIKNKTNKTLPLLKEKTSMTHKFNVGDKVRVKKDLVSDRYYIGNNGDELYFSPGMENYRGNVFTISSIICNGNYEFEGCYDWVFSDDMIKSIYEFDKADLKDGMVVETREGIRYMVLGDKIKGHDEHKLLNQYTDNLLCISCFSHEYNEKYTIVKVYESSANILRYYFDDDCLKLIWEREEPAKELTVAEIEEKLGYKIKVVADKE